MSDIEIGELVIDIMEEACEKVIKPNHHIKLTGFAHGNSKAKGDGSGYISLSIHRTGFYRTICTFRLNQSDHSILHIIASNYGLRSNSISLADPRCIDKISEYLEGMFLDLLSRFDHKQMWNYKMPLQGDSSLEVRSKNKNTTKTF